MSYKETREKMLGYMDSLEFVALFEGRNKDVKNKVQKLIALADNAVEDKPIDLDESRKIVKHLIFVIQRLAIERQLSKADAAFLIDLALFLDNFNNNFFKIDEIGASVQFIIRALQGHLTMVDTIRILRAQNEIMQRWSKFEPPAFKLSRMYLESLEEK